MNNNIFSNLGHVLLVDHISYVITNCSQLASHISLLLEEIITRKYDILSLGVSFKIFISRLLSLYFVLFLLFRLIFFGWVAIAACGFISVLWVLVNF